ncbi:MAG: ribulokinase [Oscillospiraceae bacterium]|nr:ribulokinase [Oscillospiraceae bacterium]
MKQYVIGVDFGTLSARAALFDVGDGTQLAESVAAYAHGVMDTNLHGKIKLEQDFALQDPRDYLWALETAVRKVLERSGVAPQQVVGLGLDCTASTVLPLDERGMPMCWREEYLWEPHAYIKLWKHHGAQKQADRIASCAADERWFDRYGHQVSCEWMLPKIMETLECNETLYRRTARFAEVGDWLVWYLTGEESHSACLAGYKAFWNEENGYPEDSFFTRLDPRLSGIVGTKLSEKIVPTGSMAGHLTTESAAWLGLTEQTLVTSALIDAHAALPSLGLVEAGKLLMILGTSTCHIVMDEKLRAVQGISGAVKDGVAPDFYAYEAGQSAVGDIFDWFVKNCVPQSYAEEAAARDINIHALLQEKAAALAVGESGLVALDWWNGNRSILSNADLTGTIVGLRLTTKPEEIYRALLEATAYGARVILEAFAAGGVTVEELYAAGGIPAKNPLMMQIYADVLGREIRVPKAAPSPALGSAIYTAVVAGCYESLGLASAAMAPAEMLVYRPIADNAAKYEKLFAVYEELHDWLGVANRHLMAKLKEI